MPVRRTIPYSSGIFFITFTCYRWLPLIDKVNGYDIVYKWFNHLKKEGHSVNGYVIMPNHVHVLIRFVEKKQRINTIVGNGKRFMAYEIVRRLQNNGETELLRQLGNGVETGRKISKKRHEVWELSFDWKDCRSRKFIRQKLRYIHNNPCLKHWDLCSAPIDYPHSSAKFYATGEQGIYPITDFSETEDPASAETLFRDASKDF